MTPEQAELVDKARALLESEARIEAAWLAGSLGQGGGDSWSDVDLLALCGEGQRGEVSAALADATRRQFEPLLLNVLFGGAVLNVVLPEWQRLDISVAEPAELARYEAARLSEGPEPAASAASKRAAAAAKIHRAIMQISKLKLARSIRTSGKPG